LLFNYNGLTCQSIGFKGFPRMHRVWKAPESIDKEASGVELHIRALRSM